MRRKAARGRALVGIDMDGDKEIRVVAVGYVGPLVQGKVPVRQSRIIDLDFRVCRLYFLSQLLGDGKGKVLLIGPAVLAYASGILPAVAGIDDHRPEPRFCRTAGLCS